MSETTIDFEQVEAMGISRLAFDEVLAIIGRQPTIDELSTLLAMWESNGKQQSLYGWLRGQHHTVELNEYLYEGQADHHALREPRVKECVGIARQLCTHLSFPSHITKLTTGLLLYMVGNVSSEFADSEYARRCLHLSDAPMAVDGHEEDCQYIEMILSALQAGKLIMDSTPVSEGGLFCSLLRFVIPYGYDILVPREVRLDSFLFGEEPGRYLAVTDEKHDDALLLKLDDARLNCCFLGRTTKGRILVDGYDFGAVADFVASASGNVITDTDPGK
jgi:phosphoribosylformylglycinamidine (FGAM) synthase-like enzyme